MKRQMIKMLNSSKLNFSKFSVLLYNDLKSLFKFSSSFPFEIRIETMKRTKSRVKLLTGMPMYTILPCSNNEGKSGGGLLGLCSL